MKKCWACEGAGKIRVGELGLLTSPRDIICPSCGGKGKLKKLPSRITGPIKLKSTPKRGER